LKISKTSVRQHVTSTSCYSQDAHDTASVISELLSVKQLHETVILSDVEIKLGIYQSSCVHFSTVLFF